MKAPKQAKIEEQQTLMDVINDNFQVLTLSSGRKVKIGWIRPDTQDKLDTLFVNYEMFKKSLSNQDNLTVTSQNKTTRKYYAQTIAAIIINNYFGLKLFWGIKWRIIYHFWHLNGDDYNKIILEAKKKATEQQYYLGMALLMTMSSTWTMMTKKEAEAYRQELELVGKQPL
ncbi:MAG: hypothetical protein NC083_08765 [Muribaculum sp.]|nr:hypothetical protein [Muribaculum sp.]MCM1577050.1 hypothetical protein [Bacteroides sp.]